MGTYVSGTPVRGGARSPYFTMRSQASFTTRSAAAETPSTPVCNKHIPDYFMDL